VLTVFKIKEKMDRDVRFWNIAVWFDIKGEPANPEGGCMSIVSGGDNVMDDDRATIRASCCGVW
jgi:hypothetical protein